MASFCNFTVIGNLVRDPEVRYTGNGKAIAKYTLASSVFKRDSEGNGKEETSFIPVTTFGKQAENDQKYLAKGAMVAVKGNMVSWYDKAKNKGGINFEAVEVKYLVKAKSNEQGASESTTPEQTTDDDWAAAYKAAEEAEN